MHARPPSLPPSPPSLPPSQVQFYLSPHPSSSSLFVWLFFFQTHQGHGSWYPATLGCRPVLVCGGWRLGVTPVKKMDFSSQVLSNAYVVTQLLVGLCSTSSSRSWNFVWVETAQVLCMLSQLLWLSVCNSPLVSRKYCFLEVIEGALSPIRKWLVSCCNIHCHFCTSGISWLASSCSLKGSQLAEIDDYFPLVLNTTPS